MSDKKCVGYPAGTSASWSEGVSNGAASDGALSAELAREICNRRGPETVAEQVERSTALLAAHDQKVREQVLEEAARVVKKWNFMACSDADGLEADIRALASRAEEKETK